MPRLFTAIEIPRETASEIALLRGGLPGARWIEAENYHITLRFIGDVGARMAREVEQALFSIRRSAFPVALERVESFGGGKPRAVVVRVKASAPMAGLKAEQDRLLQGFGLAPEERKFTPHVTLARLRGASSSAVAAYMGTQGFLPPPAFTATRFVLMSSRDSIGGGPYVIEAEYPLRQQSEIRPAPPDAE